MAMTNYDRIKNMTEEELAKFISEFSACNTCEQFDKRLDRCGADNHFVCAKEYAEAIIGGRFGTADASADAVNSLNIVRERAGLEPYLGSTQHNAFFNELVDERLRELCFEGLRKQDLVRWNLVREKLDELDEAIRFNSFYVETDAFHQTYREPGLTFDRSRHMLLPYPLQEVTINTELDQRLPW